MARASRKLWLTARRAGALAILGLCAACANVGDPVGYSIVTQDKYDFQTCREIVGNRSVLLAREKALNASIEKAQASPGGFLVGAAAYRSDLVETRAKVRAANRALLKNGCVMPISPPTAPAR